MLLARWEGRPAGFAVVRVGHAHARCATATASSSSTSSSPPPCAATASPGPCSARVAGLAERHGADQILSGAPPSAREVHRFLARLGFTPLVLRRVDGDGDAAPSPRRGSPAAAPWRTC